MSTSRTSTKTSRKSWIFFRFWMVFWLKQEIQYSEKGFLVVSWIRRWWRMVFTRKTLQLAFLVRTETFNWSLEKNEGPRATWHALITEAFLSPPVLKVISCDYVSVHPGLGVMAGVECFRAVCSAVRLPMHRASVSSSCWISLRKGAIHTSG